MRRVSLCWAAVLLGGCPPEVRPEPRCRLEYDKTVQTAAKIGAALESGPLRTMKGAAGYRQLEAVKTRFDELQTDYAAMTGQLCEEYEARPPRVDQAYYQRRRECLDRALVAMRGVELMAGGRESDPRALAHALDSKLALVSEILECPEKTAPPAWAAPAGEPLRLTAYLVCKQRQADGGYTDVPACYRETLTAGDRVKIGFEVDRAAFVYVLSYNSTGQFQALFPDPGVDNRAAPGRRYFLPPDTGWLQLDDVGGVTEIIQVVAAPAPVPELEALRGRDDPPGADGRFSEAAQRARVAVEPYVTRGWEKPAAPMTLGGAAGAPAAETVPVVVSRPGLAAVELRVAHR